MHAYHVPEPRIGMVDSMGVGARPIQPGLLGPAAPMRTGGGDWQTMLLAALQSPEIQQMLMGQEQAPMSLQAPGLLMPQAQIQPYQPAPLTALPGLFGGAYG